MRTFGPLPDVTGKSFDDAAAILKGFKLTAEPGKQDFSDTVPKDMVIGIETPTDAGGNAVAIHPGDTVNLTVSRGKEQVQVPDVIGQTWDKAKPILVAAHLTVKAGQLAESAPTMCVVTKTNPEPNTTVDKDSTVKVTTKCTIFN